MLFGERDDISPEDLPPQFAAAPRSVAAPPADMAPPAVATTDPVADVSASPALHDLRTAHGTRWSRPTWWPCWKNTAGTSPRRPTGPGWTAPPFPPGSGAWGSW